MVHISSRVLSCVLRLTLRGVYPQSKHNQVWPTVSTSNIMVEAELNSCAHWVSSVLTLLIQTTWCWTCCCCCCCCCPQLGQLHCTGQDSGHSYQDRSNLREMPRTANYVVPHNLQFCAFLLKLTFLGTKKRTAQSFSWFPEKSLTTLIRVSH